MCLIEIEMHAQNLLTIYKLESQKNWGDLCGLLMAHY
jgi:hypothetical protein